MTWARGWPFFEWPKNPAFRAAALIGGGSLVGQALVALVTPLVSRLYGPEEFGVLALFGSLMTPLGILSTCRFETSIPLAKEDAEAQDLLFLCFGLALGTALVVAMILQGARLLGLSAAWGRWAIPFGWLLPLGMIVIGAYQSLSYWATRKQAFRPIAATRLTQALASVLTQMGAYALLPKGLGLLLGFVVGQGFGVRPLWRAYCRSRPGRMGPLLAGMLQVARSYGTLSVSGVLTALALALGNTLPPWSLPALMGWPARGSSSWPRGYSPCLPRLWEVRSPRCLRGRPTAA